MNPFLMQIWMTAFEVGLKVEANVGGFRAPEEQGLRAAQYAEGVLQGAQRAAAEAKEQNKVVRL
jgi:hypothetical protein